jgi:uncharacterized membrane protein YoaK (UPF0700 family)
MASRSIPSAVLLLLSFVAGYVDGCTYLALFGLFVAQVTASFVLTGAQLVAPSCGIVVKLVGIPVFFLAGMAATVIVKSVERRARDALPPTLGLEAVLLTCLLISWLVSSPFRGPHLPAALSASLCGLSAMGVQSALVRLLLQDSPSTNVMTTNTTQFAIDTTELVLAWSSKHRAPTDTNAEAEHTEVLKRWTRHWSMMLGFFLGTLAGAGAYVRLDLWCVLLPIAIIGTLLAWATASNKIPTGQRPRRLL